MRDRNRNHADLCYTFAMRNNLLTRCPAVRRMGIVRMAACAAFFACVGVCPAAVEPGENNRRFAIRIGGFPKTDQNGSRQYVVYAFDGTLHVRGLIAGDNIRVYSVTGQLILNTVATTEEFTAELPQAGGVYAVRVNDFSTKVRNL